MDIKIPKGQTLCQSFREVDGTIKQIITSNQLCTKYYLYNVAADGVLTKIDTNTVPIFKKHYE